MCTSLLLLLLPRLRSVYNLPTAQFNGNGTTIAILAYQQYDPITVVDFAEANNLPFGEDIFDIFVSNPSTVDDDDPGPTLVNLELVIAVAPLAKIRVSMHALHIVQLYVLHVYIVVYVCMCKVDLQHVYLLLVVCVKLLMRLLLLLLL